VSRLDAGDHACLTFSDAEERLDLMAAFVRDGLRARQRVVCWTDSITPESLIEELSARSVGPRAALGRGQLRVASAMDSLLGGGPADAAGMVAALAAELDRAGHQGYPSLRVTADMCWATRPVAAAGELLEFETRVAELFAGRRLCLICQYDRDRFDQVTLAFAAKVHQRTVAARIYHEHPLRRICRQYSPPGIRVAGELDYRHRDVLDQALGESMRLDRHIHVNLAGLDYIDGACAGVIVTAACRLPKTRRMTVTCRPLVATVLELAGADGLPRLRVEGPYGRL
jgi:anti-anti-sigma regulatory factor